MGSKHRDSKDFPDSPRDWGFRESMEQELRNRKSLREDFVYKDFDTGQYVRPNSPPPFTKKSVVPSGPIGKFNSFDPPEEPKLPLEDYAKPAKVVKFLDLMREYQVVQGVRMGGKITTVTHLPVCIWETVLPLTSNVAAVIEEILQHEKSFHGKRIKIHEDEDG